ncbi:hypothetical protein GF1_09970 [Desulfolithobacter dissulfuricans]|uniref:DUF3352 domain-containing protein n=1 Tax=Desulfolithobacter dissulfuricans TaxID=2795293 RepID=A0A915XKR6_9BACT|nr:hypothetical protein [Desulfolithobacter dissulfuricans]BCO08621.1 hypothetical protein GF1_09970 [Desulfolithobacter dissulfuricans]
MKRLVLLLALLAVLAGSGYYLGTGLRKEARPEDVIPASASLVLAWDNPVAAYQSFRRTPLGTRLRGIDWAGVLADLEMDEALSKTILKQIPQIDRLATSSLAREFFSRRVFVTLLPARETGTGSGSIRKQFVVVTEPAHPARMFELLDTVVAPGPGAVMEQYQGRTIRKYPLAHKLTLYVTRIDGLLLGSLDPVPLRRCLDENLARLTRSRTGLANNSGYAALIKKGGPARDVFFYADSSGIANLAAAALLAGADRKVDLESLRGFLAPLECGALFLDRGREVRRLTTVLRLDPVRLSPLAQNLLARRPVINRKTSVMPADLVVYFWSNWLDLPAWWQKIPGPKAREIEAAVLEQSGLSMDAFFSLFGEEFGFNVAEIRTSGFVPVPRICLCVELRDRQRLAALLDTRLKGLPLRREKVAGGEIVSLMAAGGLMQPSYALLEKFLIVADGRDQIDAILPATVSPASRSARLADDPDFIQVDVGMMKPANVIFFARISRLVPGLKEFASWGSILLSIWDKEAARKSQILVDRIVHPLLDGLSMFRALALRGTVQGRDLVWQAGLSRERSKLRESDHR